LSGHGNKCSSKAFVLAIVEQFNDRKDNR
jgi:hypothetical protein